MSVAVLCMAVAAVAGFLFGLFLAKFFGEEIGAETVNLWPVNPRLVAPQFRGRLAKDKSFVLSTPAEIMRYVACRIGIGMLDDGIPILSVARELGVDAGDLGRWMDLYRDGGIDALLEPSVPQAGCQERGDGNERSNQPLPVSHAEPPACGGDSRGHGSFVEPSGK